MAVSDERERERERENNFYLIFFVFLSFMTLLLLSARATMLMLRKEVHKLKIVLLYNVIKIIDFSFLLYVLLTSNYSCLDFTHLQGTGISINPRNKLILLQITIDVSSNADTSSLQAHIYILHVFTK